MSLIERAMSGPGKRPQKTGSTPDQGSAKGVDRPSTVERAVAEQQRPPAQKSPRQITPHSAVSDALLDLIPDTPAPSPKRSRPSTAVHHDAAAPAAVITISIDKLRSAGMVTPDGSNIEVTAEFRVIKRPLLENAFSRIGQSGASHANTIMITSAIPGEGKSFCAMNLAMSLAMEPDHNVILVDADVHRFTALRELGVESQLKDKLGLVDLLSDPSLSIESCVYHTNIDKLSVLPFGRFHARATELFGSRAMFDRIDQLCAHYQNSMIVFDCPPILATTEARVLSSQLGQVVFVVEAERTQRDQLKEALAIIENANVVGTILNKNLNKAAHDYYSSYYYAAA